MGLGIKTALATKLVSLATDNVVLAGPFSGMRYITKAFFSTIFPKYFGTYELELHPYLSEIICDASSRYLDIGAADGYYAVGLAKANSHATVVAYEESDEARELLQDLSKLNGVSERLRIEGRCDCLQLRQELQSDPSSILIMDIEGGEETLLDPQAIPELAELTFGIIEIHSTAIGQKVISRFKSTHIIDVVVQRPRRNSDFPELRFPYKPVLSLYWHYFLNEQRGDTFWIVLRKQKSLA